MRSAVLVLALTCPRPSAVVTGAAVQVNGPAGASRYTRGQSWNSDGTIDDSKKAGPINGIVSCSNSAQPQTSIEPTGVYAPSDFRISLPANTCIEPSSGSIVNVAGPTQGQPVLWFNFDVRARAHTWEAQLKGQGNVAWALYYSNTPTRGTSPMPITGNELSGTPGDVSFFMCGVKNAQAWSQGLHGEARV
ncbi:hypothetical protein AB1Y20_015634 [Prymnesium parvum]|uniref:Uncharacterized protein n=1 Tax=Prymnesium parvum TaxID=97485 RepID=A0AB34K3K8_PRYPA